VWSAVEACATAAVAFCSVGVCSWASMDIVANASRIALLSGTISKTGEGVVSTCLSAQIVEEVEVEVEGAVGLVVS
jgi:hypothetical protein